MTETREDRIRRIREECAKEAKERSQQRSVAKMILGRDDRNQYGKRTGPVRAKEFRT